MAARHLRRLQQQPQPAVAVSHDDDPSTDESEEQEETTAPFNPFDLLTDGDDEPGAAEQDDEEDAEEEESQAKPETVKPVASKASSSKKKNKKKKGKGKQQADDSDDEGAAAAGAQDEEDLDKLLLELNITPAQQQQQQAGSGPGAGLAPLLAVEPRHLRGDEELRRIFGSEVITAVDKEDQMEQQAQQRRYQVRGQPQRRRPLKKGLLASPKDTWPPLAAGLAMEPDGVVDGCRRFKYVRGDSYKATQAAFEHVQASFDPNALVALMQRSPYHTDTLMAMYDLYRHTGDNQYAEEVLAMALYSLEAAWHPGFDVSSANCRLDYEEEENKGLFTALFRHLQALSRKGCHRSALECCKLLLAMDPRDPLGALFYIDYLSLRAAQYGFLQRLAWELQHGCSLALLPNFAFSLALARFWQEQEQEGQGEAGTSSSASSSKRGSKQQAQQQQAREPPPEQRGSSELLVQAILLHPLVVPRLMAKLQGQGVGKDSWWSSLLARPLLQDKEDGNATLQHLVNLFVERHHLLWKAPQVQTWIKKACDRAVDIAEGKQEAGEAGLGAEDWACVRQEAFSEGAAANQYRHLRLHDFSDTVNALPREEVAAAMQAGGPAEVEDVLAELQAQAIAMEQAAARRGGRQLNEAELRNANPLMVLLQSLLPWVDAGQQPQYDQQQQDGQQPGEQ